MSAQKRFALPDAGEGLTEAEIVSWKVGIGDTVTVNQVIVEIETAKSLVELPSPWAGVVRELLAAEGQTVEVGAHIIVIDAPGESPDPTGPTSPADTQHLAHDPAQAAAHAVRHPATAKPAPEPVAQTAAPAETSGATLVGYGARGAGTTRRRRPVVGESSVAAVEEIRHVLAKPPVRKLARDLGVDLAETHASGPGGTITRADVLAMVPSAPSEPGRRVERHDRERHVPIRGVRKATAAAMVESAFSAPHVTVFTEVDVTRTMKLVQRIKVDKEFDGIRVSPLLLVAKALMVAVRRNPDVNATWDEQNQVIVVKNYVNLGIAVATPRGLMVPNVKDADAMTLKELALAFTELTATARAGKATPRDLSEGTITITNVGTFGIDTGTPILVPGEAAILAVGTIKQRPWVHHDKVKPRWTVTLGLSIDHRMLDGESGSRVLADIAAVLEDPARAVVWS